VGHDDAVVPQSASSDLRIAVIGLGLRGGLAATAHRPGRGARVVALCDLSPPNLASWANHIAGTGGGEPFTTNDHRRLLERTDIDAVIIATPDDTHETIAIDTLTAGKATFCEKPLAITTEGCDRILATAMRSGTRLYVGHNMRHFMVVRLMKQLIDAGVIGEPQAVWCRHFVGHGGDFYFKDWHAERRHTTSLLLQKGAHDIDVIHWLADGVGRSVQGMGGLTVYNRVTDRHHGRKADNWFDPARNWPPLAQRQLEPVIDVEDLSMLQMRMDNGVVASYQQCHYTPDYWRNYTVIGTEGRIENFGDMAGVVRLWNQRHDYAERGDREFPFSPSAGGHGGADERLMDEFLRFARDGGTTDTSPVAAREAVAVGCAAALSLRSGGVPVAVPALPDVMVDYFAAGQTRS
jgi:predicted dehydrogenase